MRFAPSVRHNGKENPIGIETYMSEDLKALKECHNGKENPIGIETHKSTIAHIPNISHNGKENPIGIETSFSHSTRPLCLVTMEKKTR
ncbi:hypothetical protein Mhun_1853 [Methanospirillum hungatei JF-1]|uniref:Uncharacterized protein n=1 Tax=Methanospirillum hungatei JF-1 (strain ATCC 27890 / DSM 864 / NBRC 100397 / JF-1) TaxID=323259 RepID=Q2FQQ3_METHJ|nr:hypothetical protein Mhun_1853 [Methanospirillum hungatei JF-1]